MTNLLKRRGTEMIAQMAWRYLEGDPEENLPKLLKFIESVDMAESSKELREKVQGILDTKESPWYEYLLSFWQDIDTSVFKRFFNTCILNAYLTRKKKEVEQDCTIPWLIRMDNTCDDTIRQGKLAGTYVYCLTQKPKNQKTKDKGIIIALCLAHPDCAFFAPFPDGVIDEAFASQLLSVQNLYPVIAPSDEQTLKLLREKRLLFGLQDALETGALVATGAKFIWSCSEDTRPCHPLEMTVEKSPSVG
ncbi:hypothetical protein [uncultured Sphaerochaeta sp.]|uniref:hypothetical protein n=1 Tax=uncultured Sphaerochaeta sp. TaxID=886478 RepID=UPI002A0A83B8|nr:hypothetical protein [uncultured Sphaerochaeta sp.]